MPPQPPDLFQVRIVFRRGVEVDFARNYILGHLVLTNAGHLPQTVFYDAGCGCVVSHCWVTQAAYDSIINCPNRHQYVQSVRNGGTE